MNADTHTDAANTVPSPGEIAAAATGHGNTRASTAARFYIEQLRDHERDEPERVLKAEDARLAAEIRSARITESGVPGKNETERRATLEVFLAGDADYQNCRADERQHRLELGRTRATIGYYKRLLALEMALLQRDGKDQ